MLKKYSLTSFYLITFFGTLHFSILLMYENMTFFVIYEVYRLFFFSFFFPFLFSPPFIQVVN